jgi:putative transposase
MPRISRAIWPGIPYHVTQRGNRREPVFFAAVDRYSYLKLLSEYAALHSVEVLAYCLMTNHVHLVLVPSTEEGLHRMLRPLHMRYAQRVNRGRGWRGHLWQGRFFSSMLDEPYLWSAIRYVELNPVRAGMVRRAEDYRWSSALAHCSGRHDPCLTTEPSWQARLASIGDWSAWLAAGDQPECLDTLRRNADKGLPCGSDEFVEQLERLTGHRLRALSRGRPRRER